MSRINEKLGLRPAGQRAMMKGLPKTLAERNRITSAKCPKCSLHGARVLKNQAGWVWCSWCAHRWELPADV